jgi:hypothetical protein
MPIELLRLLYDKPRFGAPPHLNAVPQAARPLEVMEVP